MSADRTALLTDLYQLNMLAAYLDHGLTDTAVFELFVRKLPPRRGFLMAAGLEQALGYLETLAFSPEDIARLRALGGFSERFLEFLSGLRFTGDVDALPEGTVFFPDEPILRVIASLPQAQLVETRLINLVHFETVIASKAARLVLAAEEKPLIDTYDTERAAERVVGLARFPFVRDLDGFDFAAQPSIDKKQIREIAGGRFIANAEVVMLMGPPGVGKTHLAVAIGRQAILTGYSVLFVPAPTLVAQLAKAHSEGRLEDRLIHFGKPKLLIIDELGYLPFEPNAAHLFFQLVSRRYERGSMLITSNRAVGEWGTVFGDAVVATAILDRLLHHSHVLTIRGDSYRLREKRRSGLLKAPAIESAAAPA